MKKFLALLLCMAMVAAVLVGCESAPAASGGSEEGAGVGGEKVIEYCNGPQPEAMDPVTSNYLAYSTVEYNIYTGLTHLGPNGVAELAYADEYSVSDDGLVWTFHIREDSHWSNGDPLDATDWEKSMEYLLRPETNARALDLLVYIKNAEKYNLGECTWDEVGYKAIDDHTLQITTANPCTYFLDICCTYIPLHLDTVENNPDWAKNPETYITNGPFRVIKIVDQSGFYCEKNPYYYNAEEVKIDKLNFNWIDDQAVEFSAYVNGTINVSDNLGPQSDATYASTEEYHKASRIGVRYLTINTEHIPDVRVRKAMSYAVDRNMLLTITQETHEPANGLVPYGIHWGDKQFREVADEKHGVLAYYDIEKAKELLSEAGYPNGEGLPTYTYICKNTDTARAQALQDMWKQIGVNVDIVPYESSVYWDVFDTEDWDIGDDNWTGDYDDPNTNLFLWEEYREHNDDGSPKDAHWVNDQAIEYDRLLKQTYVETDYETRMNLFVQAETVILGDMPVIPIYYYNDTILIKSGITGVLKSYLGHCFFEYADIAS